MKLTSKQVEIIITLMNEAAENLRSLMDSEKADSEQIREWLPDELEGSAFMLRDHFSEADEL